MVSRPKWFDKVWDNSIVYYSVTLEKTNNIYEDSLFFLLESRFHKELGKIDNKHLFKASPMIASI